MLKRFVVAAPDIVEERLGPGDRHLILASDGLWDVISNGEAVRIIQVRVPPAPCARLHILAAYSSTPHQWH